jgi:hypothetical protein
MPALPDPASSPSPEMLEHYWQQGLSFPAYMQRMQDIIHQQKTLDNPPVVDKFQYYILNQQRSQRLLKTYAVPTQLSEQLKKTSPQHWLIITEYWCGDSAQNLPPLFRMSECSEGRINMRLVFRDTNPQLIDAFATEGAKSIPKVLMLSKDFKLKQIWGPRPAEAQALVKSLRADPATRDFYADRLHLWYAQNKCHMLEQEIANLLMLLWTK